MTVGNRLQHGIDHYDAWKAELIDAIGALQEWLDKHDNENGAHALQIFEASESLKKDRLTLAFVAEFSRGKSELINAIFFADYQRRLLPSEAGRTTMCPTELFYDREADEAYIRLLPIETRLEDTTISEYKLDPVYWTHTPLNVESPEQMEDALREIIATKRVPVDQARRLGLYNDDDHHQHGVDENGDVEVPKWRHALISFPHPLLKSGLVILDTPGLNALGSEPELTMNMLPAAQSVLFLLAADTGVTRSDLDIWQHHISGARRSRRDKSVAVVLNKIDTLWDDLKDEHTVGQSIDSQVRKTATLLGIKPDAIFPVSAQKGLLAKVRDDRDLLGKSRLQQLEQYLCEEVLPARQSIISASINAELGSLLDQHHGVLSTRRNHVQQQLRELRNLSGKNADVILHLMQKSRSEQTAYQKNVESFQSSRRVLQQQGQALLDSLDLDHVDRLIRDTRSSMSGSWTTAGLKRGMKTFIEGIQEISDNAVEQAETTRKLGLAIFRKFQAEHGITAGELRPMDIEKPRRALVGLLEEAEAFRKSPVTTMTEQSFVTKKFFINLVSQARNILFKANQELSYWLKHALDPLVAQIKEQKEMTEKRLKTLRKISDSRDTLETKLSELEAESVELDKEIKNLDGIRNRLTRPTPFQPASSSAA